MSIATELNKTISGLQNARRAILARGGTINTTAGLKDLPEAIFNMPTGDALGSYTDSEIAYEKVVYPMAEKYARVAQIGGMTYKTKNLLPNTTIEVTKNGVTFTPQSDGSIIINGTASANAAYEFSIYGGSDFHLTKGTNYTLSGCPIRDGKLFLRIQDETRSQTITNASSPSPNFVASYEDYFAFLYIESGYTANNIVVKPMLNEGSAALPYEPYFTGLRDTKVTKLESAGANLLNIEAPLSVPNNTDSNNQTPRLFEHGTIIHGMAFNNYYQPKNATILNRTSNSITYTHKNGYGMGFAFDLQPNTKYTVTCECDIDTLQIGAAHYDMNGNVLYFGGDVNHVLTFTTGEAGKCVIVFLDQTTGMGDEKEMTISNVMLVKGSNVAPYKPYRTDLVDTWDIPKAIQSLDGYGDGIYDGYYKYYNYIDYNRKIYVQNAYKLVLDGITNGKKIERVLTANGLYYGTLKISYSSVYNPAPMTSHFVKYTNTIQAGVAYIAGTDIKDLIMYNIDQTLTTVNDWNAWLKAQYDSGNPITIVYALAEPIETDISAYLPNDNFIAVEGGGVLTFVNEHKQPIPSTIQYLYKTEGE